MCAAQAIPSVSEPAYPRRRTCEDLLHVIKSQPKLAKEAASALIEIGQSMQSTATPDETQALLYGTLQQEVYVRNACLQALQVRRRAPDLARHANITVALRPDRP